jgi:hypothetical protein
MTDFGEMARMAERVLKILTGLEGEHRVLIVQRADGAYSYRQQSLTELASERLWGALGPHAGIYDSAETAEREALARVKWLQAS